MNQQQVRAARSAIFFEPFLTTFKVMELTSSQLSLDESLPDALTSGVLMGDIIFGAQFNVLRNRAGIT